MLRNLQGDVLLLLRRPCRESHSFHALKSILRARGIQHWIPAAEPDCIPALPESDQ